MNLASAPKPLLLLAHKALGHGILLIAGFGVLGAVDFESSITLGSVIIAVTIAALGFLFTARSKIATIWRQEAEGERAAKERLAEELHAAQMEIVEHEKEQQAVRHDLKDKIAGLEKSLQAMQAKTDLSVALDAIRDMNQTTTESVVVAVSEAVTRAIRESAERSEQRDEQTLGLLGEIRDKLPSEPFIVQVNEDDVVPHRK